MSTPEPVVTVALPEHIDRRPVTRFQYGILTLCGAVMLIDGFDTQAISYMAPAIARQWHLPTAVLGPIFSSALVGLMIGYLVLSPLSDGFGHKRMVITTTVAFSVVTLVSVFAQDVTQLMILRLLTGIGLGAAAPSAIALTGEFAPRRLRATFVLVIYCGFSLGFVVAGAAAGSIMPAYGWRSMFLLSGAIPLVLTPLLVKFLPESLEFMVRKDSTPHRLQSTMRRLDPDIAAGATVTMTEHETAKAGRLPVSRLFTNQWLLGTVLLWIIFAINLAEFYALQSWLPTILTRLDYPTGVVVAATTLTTVGGIAAALITGPSMDRLGAYATVAIVYVLGFVFVGFTGMSLHAPLWILMAANFLAGCCVSGGQKSVIALGTVFYPAAIRSTGVGWALGIGRLGGIVGPLLVGAMVAAHWSFASVFYALAIPMLVAAAAVFVLGRSYGRARTDAAESATTVAPGR